MYSEKYVRDKGLVESVGIEEKIEFFLVEIPGFYPQCEYSHCFMVQFRNKSPTPFIFVSVSIILLHRFV